MELAWRAGSARRVADISWMFSTFMFDPEDADVAGLRFDGIRGMIRHVVEEGRTFSRILLPIGYGGDPLLDAIAVKRILESDGELEAADRMAFVVEVGAGAIPAVRSLASRGDSVLVSGVTNPAQAVAATRAGAVGVVVPAGLIEDYGGNPVALASEVSAVVDDAVVVIDDVVGPRLLARLADAVPEAVVTVDRRLLRAMLGEGRSRLADVVRRLTGNST